ncbi:MAG: glycosyltransferase family 4 protein [Patescibacteria group bacterium]
MRIGIDARTILNPEKGEGAGIGHYTYQLIRHLLKIDKKNDYFLFFDKTVQNRRLAKFKQENVRVGFFPFIQYAKFLPGGYWHFLASAFLTRHRLDVFHSPTLNLPQSYRAPTVVTAHDLTVYKFPELYNTKKQRTILKSTIPQAIKMAKKIIAVSYSTKKDLGEIFGVESEKVRVIYHGVDERFFRKSDSATIEKIKMKFGIKNDYLLFLGTLESRKNIFRIIEAYERLRDKISSLEHPIANIQLVLAGAPGFNFKKIDEKISHSKYKEDIILPGYIEADDLDPLFEGAKVFVFPTLYEGFGLPVIEAMANGVPVITSNISSLPEIAEERAILVDPLNVAEISQAMFDLLTRQDLWQKLSQLGKEKAKEFDWQKTAAKTLEVYKEATEI